MSGKENSFEVLILKYRTLIAKTEADLGSHRSKLAVLEELQAEASQTQFPLTDNKYQTVGLTEALLDLLKASRSNDGISGTNVRQMLLEHGFPKAKHFSANVHTTLKRLEKQGEVRSELKEGERFYIKP